MPCLHSCAAIRTGAVLRHCGFAPPRPHRGVAPETKEHANVKLKVRGQLALAHRDEVIPECLNFLVVMVDAEDLPMNFSRETLRQNKILPMMRQNLVKKVP